MATWAEHLRQHRRFTRDDQAVEAQVRQLHRGTGRRRLPTSWLSPKQPT